MAKERADDARRAIDAQLRSGEVFRVLIPVLIPPPDVGGGWGPAAVIIPLFWAVKRSMWRRAAATVQARVGIPVRHRMLWGTTDQRVLIFAAGRQWEVGPFIGSIDRPDIVGASATTIGPGWRSVMFELANRPSLHVKIPARFVDPILNAFGRNAGS